MTQLYANGQAMALRMLTDYGHTVTVRETAAPTTPDSARPWEITKNTVDHSVTAMLDTNAADQRDNTAIRQHDRQYLVPASGLTVVPKVGWELIDTDTYEIVTVEQIGDTACVYRLQVRK